jgi:hypothetical protein
MLRTPVSRATKRDSRHWTIARAKRRNTRFGGRSQSIASAIPSAAPGRVDVACRRVASIATFRAIANSQALKEPLEGSILIEARSTGGSIQAGRDCLKLGLPLFAAVYEGSPESATGNEELLRNGAKRLMKSKARDLPNMTPVLQAIANPPMPPDAAPQLF